MVALLHASLDPLSDEEVDQGDMAAHQRRPGMVMGLKQQRFEGLLVHAVDQDVVTQSLQCLFLETLDEGTRGVLPRLDASNLDTVGPTAPVLRQRTSTIGATGGAFGTTLTEGATDGTCGTTSRG